MIQNFIEKIGNYNWHDCTVYSMQFDDNLILDLDYILEWKLKNNSCEYLIAPALLEFSGVSDFRINVKADILNGFEIDKIIFEENKCKIFLQEGIVEFKADRFYQKLTKEPIWKSNQYLSEEERKNNANL